MTVKEKLKEEKDLEIARRKEEKEREVAYHQQWQKPKKVETYTKQVHGSTGVKIKTIERRIYPNGVVKERLKKVEKDTGGSRRRIF